MIGDGDVATIFESGHFDTTATFANALSVQGWFTGATESVNLLTNEIEAVQPAFDCESTQLEQPGSVIRKGMTVAINSTTYTIERIHKLGTGVSTLFLKT